MGRPRTSRPALAHRPRRHRGNSRRAARHPPGAARCARSAARQFQPRHRVLHQRHSTGNEKMTDEPANLPTVPQTPMEMVAHAVANGADPTTLERLLAMKERFEENEARKAFDQAIAKARSEIGPIFKSAEARMGQGKPNYRYETLDDIEGEVVPA